MRKAAITLLLIFCSLLPGVVAEPVQKSRNLPPQYYEDYGACPFECCTYRRWTVNASTVFYQGRTNNSPALFRAGKGEHVVGLTGVVITLKPGRAVVRKATVLGQDKKKVRVKAGDILYLLHYEGEGVYKFWFGGRIYEANMPFAPDMVYQSPDAKGVGEVRLISEPQTVWWVKVRNERGQIGWSKQDGHFDDMDACG
ncbi:MAG TPA: hypothetical protein VEV81_04055 [Pyrinomonadaceae bacterium]|nr:hypothetical protein [Pyrinomonadaceae bacterium]